MSSQLKKQGMNIYEFNALREDDQLTCLWEQGTFLLSRHVGRSCLNLYAMGDFFVEIRYESDWNEITACRSFKNHILLEPYLTQIAVPHF